MTTSLKFRILHKHNVFRLMLIILRWFIVLTVSVTIPYEAFAANSGDSGVEGNEVDAEQVLAVTYPKDGTYLLNSSVQVTGTVETNNLESVAINGLAAFTGGGLFIASISLAEGTNDIIAVATYKGGKQYASKIKVTLDTTPPKVVGAISLSNTAVLLQFSEPVIGGNKASNINIVTAEYGANLPVWNALNYDGNTADDVVLLKTLSQSAAEYILRVSNVHDVAGNPIASPTFMIDSGKTNFFGMDPGFCYDPDTNICPKYIEVADSDEDGLSDHVELFGWNVKVRNVNGSESITHVTSEPGDPNASPLDDVNIYARDTDSDLLTDSEERWIGLNPRSSDTDSDLLPDYMERNQIESDPADQDSDGDGYDDGNEFFFYKTSPLHEDSDGDQTDDNVEIALGNRNPRVAELPAPDLEVNEVALRLDTRFSESNAIETREIDAKTVESTLTQSESRAFSHTNSNTQEAFVKASLETEINIGASTKELGYRHRVNIGVEAGWSGSWHNEWTNNSAVETQKAYQESLTTSVESTEGATVNREVVGASIKVTMLLKKLTDIAYTLHNLQVTALISDPVRPEKLTPIAILRPESEPENGYAIGPLSPEIGPLILASDTIFPQLVEDLMRNPRGLIFKISNFDIVDEFGRNFAFSSQEVTERTAALVIDPGGFDADGDGEGDLTEYHRVAVGSGRAVADTNGDGIINAYGFDANEDGIIDAFETEPSQGDQRVIFDGPGHHVGISLRDALEAIGLSHYDEDVIPSLGLSSVELESSYSTLTEKNVVRLYRIGSTFPDTATLSNWLIMTPTGIDNSISLDAHTLQAGGDIKLVFSQDIDKDLIPAPVEISNNCSDQFSDTDKDTLDDRFETLIGWEVETGHGKRRVYSSCILADTDGDGLTDAEEAPASFRYLKVKDSDNNYEPLLIAAAIKQDNADYITDPTSADTDGDGLSDKAEIEGFKITLRGEHDPKTFKTDPNNPDTDGDGASDSIEKKYGGDPTTADIDNFADYDGDGLVNIVETTGWDVKITDTSRSEEGDRCIIACDEGYQDDVYENIITSDPMIADTDFDGLLDGEERELGTNPRSPDSDYDGLTDLQEVAGVEVHDLGIIFLDPLDRDTDNDKLTDGMESGFVDGVYVDNEKERWIIRPYDKDPYLVVSDPLQADADFDTLVDGDEYAKRSDPTLADTDGDGVFDGDEFDKGTNLLKDSLSITVGFEKIHFLQERKGSISTTDGDYHDWYACDKVNDIITRNPGEFVFDFGAKTGDTTLTAVNASADKEPKSPEPLNIRKCNADKYTIGKETYDSACRLNDIIYIPAVWNVSNNNFQVADLSLENKSVTIDLAPGDEITIFGNITEKDNNALDIDDKRNGFPFSLDTTNSLYLKGAELGRSATIAVDELQSGVTKGTFRKRGGLCEFDIGVFIRKQ